MFNILKPLVVSPFVSQTLHPFLSHESRDDLAELKTLLESGKVTPAVDRTYPLDAAAEAMTYLAKGHARGKVVVTT